MEQQHRRRVARALVEVVNAQAAGVDVVRLEVVAGQGGESVVRSTQRFHGRDYSPVGYSTMVSQPTMIRTSTLPAPLMSSQAAPSSSTRPSSV